MTESTKQAGKIKPFLLSFAVFPGLGQLSQGKKILGIAIMFMVSICIFIVLTEAFSQINEAAQRMVAEGSTDFYRAQQESHTIMENLNTPEFLGALYLLIALWIGSAIEVFRPGKT